MGSTGGAGTGPGNGDGGSTGPGRVRRAVAAALTGFADLGAAFSAMTAQRPDLPGEPTPPPTPPPPK